MSSSMCYNRLSAALRQKGFYRSRRTIYHACTFEEIGECLRVSVCAEVFDSIDWRVSSYHDMRKKWWVSKTYLLKDGSLSGNAAMRREKVSVHERVCYVDLIRVLLTNAHDHDIQFSDASWLMWMKTDLKLLTVQEYFQTEDIFIHNEWFTSVIRRESQWYQTQRPVNTPVSYKKLIVRNNDAVLAQYVKMKTLYTTKVVMLTTNTTIREWIV